MSESEQPKFLSPESGSEGVKFGRWFHPGSFVSPVELDAVDPKTAEQVPTGSVLKEYSFPDDEDSGSKEESARDLFLGEATAQEALDFSPREILIRLKERQRLLAEYFTNAGLPDFVVPTQFFLGEDKDKQLRVYEIQKRIDALRFPSVAINLSEKIFLAQDVDTADYLDLPTIKSLIDRDSKLLAKWLRDSLTPEEFDKILAELKKMVEISQNMPRETGKVSADILKPKNLLITKDGLRMIDANFSVPVPKTETPNWDDELFLIEDYDSSAEVIDFYVQAYERTIALWEQVIKELENKSTL